MEIVVDTVVVNVLNSLPNTDITCDEYTYKSQQSPIPIFAFSRSIMGINGYATHRHFYWFSGRHHTATMLGEEAAQYKAWALSSNTTSYTQELEEINGVMKHLLSDPLSSALDDVSSTSNAS